MANTGATDREQRAGEYLDAARSLIRELERAMLAICRNQLADLEESIGEQEILTARLTGLQGQLAIRTDTHLAIAQADQELAKEIVTVQAELQGLNRIYAAVLRHSSHAACLRTSLVDSFRGHFQEASGPRSKVQTWSCQV